MCGKANPAGEGGVRARGGDLTTESIFSVGGLSEYLCSGVGTFDLFVFLLLWEWCICRSYCICFLIMKSPVVS